MIIIFLIITYCSHCILISSEFFKYYQIARQVMGKRFKRFFPSEWYLTLTYINITQHNTTQHNTTQHNTTQHNTTQHNTTQHNTTQHNTTQHNMTKLYYMHTESHYSASLTLSTFSSIPSQN
jgi:hypothetical protein